MTAAIYSSSKVAGAGPVARPSSRNFVNRLTHLEMSDAAMGWARPRAPGPASVCSPRGSRWWVTLCCIDLVLENLRAESSCSTRRFMRWPELITGGPY